MKTLDFVIQSTLIGLSALIALIALFNHELFILCLIGQFFIGIWQYGGVLVSALSNSNNKYRKKYFILSSAYLLSLFGLVFLGNHFSHHVPPSLFAIYWIIPAWCLAVYYYRLTWRTMFINHKNQSRFLPHTNF
jgi:hypothetical protein